MRQAVQNLEESKIREVANAGMGRADVLPFWFGESDEVTPLEVRQAASESLLLGETFYSHNLGLAELREALRRYTAGLHGDPGPDRIAVTSSGVTALMTAMQLLVDAGDEVVVVVPVWPNLPAQPVQWPINNNIILKKLRVAFELKDADLHDILQAADFPVSKPELSALFRKEGQKNYRPCGDQLLRNFLKGLALRLRG